MGKYDAVIPQLKPRPVEDVSWQAKVEAEKEKIQAGTTVPPIELARQYAAVRAKKAEIEGYLSGVNVQVAALEQLLAESQEAGAEGWGAYGVKENALRMPDGTTIRVQPEIYAKVVDKEAFRQWCLMNGYERQLQLWPSTMTAIVKERLLVGEPEPDGCEASSFSKIVYTPAKGEN